MSECPREEFAMWLWMHRHLCAEERRTQGRTLHLKGALTGADQTSGHSAQSGQTASAPAPVSAPVSRSPVCPHSGEVDTEGDSPTLKSASARPARD